MSLLSRLQLAAGALCDADKDRPALQYLRVRDNTVVATNGYYLIAVTRTDGVGEDAYPSRWPSASPPPGDVFIAGTTALKVVKSMPKKSDRSHARLQQLPTDTVLEIVGDTVPPQETIVIPPFYGTFPDIDRVTPSRDRPGTFSISLNAALLLPLCQYATLFTKHTQRLDFTFYSPTDPVRIDWEDLSKRHRVVVALMPIRVGPAPAPTPTPTPAEYALAHPAVWPIPNTERKSKRKRKPHAV